MSPATRWRLRLYRRALIEIAALETHKPRVKAAQKDLAQVTVMGESIDPSGCDQVRKKRVALRARLRGLQRDFERELEHDAVWAKRRRGFDVEQDKAEEQAGIVGVCW